MFSDQESDLEVMNEISNIISLTSISTFETDFMHPRNVSLISSLENSDNIVYQNSDRFFAKFFKIILEFQILKYSKKL